MRLPIHLHVRDPCAGNVRLDIGRARLDQNGVRGHALSDRGRQRNLESGAVEELDGGDALENARAGRSVAKQDGRGELSAGEGADSSEDDLQISGLAWAGAGRDHRRRWRGQQHRCRGGGDPRNRIREIMLGTGSELRAGRAAA